MTTTETTVVNAAEAPKGDMDQRYLASGDAVALRMWNQHPPQDGKESRSRTYETVGYVIGGKAELLVGDTTTELKPGDSWVVPANAMHSYRILENFTAVEATAPPARIGDRDNRPGDAT